MKTKIQNLKLFLPFLCVLRASLRPLREITLFIILCISIFSLSYSASSPAESWMNVSLMGEKLGYFHEVKDETTYKNETVERIMDEMISKLNRFGIEFNVEQSVTIYLGKDLKPRYCQYRESMMGSKKTVTAWLENGKMIEETVMGDETTRQTRDWDSNTQFDASITEVILRDGLKPDKKYNFSIFSPEMGKSFEVTVTIGSTQRISAGDVWYEAYPVKSDYSGAEELSTMTYVTKSGDVIKAEVGNYGMAMVKTTESDAKTMDSKIEIADISRIKSNVSFVEPESVTQSKLKITVTEGTPGQMIPTDSRQNWDGQAAGTDAVLIIKSPDGDMNFPDTLPVHFKSDTFGVFTSSSPYIESGDKEIASTARLVVGNEKNAWKAAVKLADFVYNYVENKGFDTGFESAKQTFKDRKGDCKQHSVLLAALTRSVGIPTKIVCGLAAVEDGYYYHMWTEVYVGQWVALDPTFNEPRVDAAHIKLAESLTKEDELGDYAIKLLKSLKKIKIEVLQYTADGQTIIPSASPASGSSAEEDAIKQLLSN